MNPHSRIVVFAQILITFYLGNIRAIRKFSVMSVAFYSHQLQPAQTCYPTTERKLLLIVETLKEFRNILMGQKIKVHTDHENLTYKNFNSDRVMKWRLYIEEYSPDLQYIKGTHNVVADALSRLKIEETPFEDTQETFLGLMEYGMFC
jgi:hypothetical protein